MAKLANSAKRTAKKPVSYAIRYAKRHPYVIAFTVLCFFVRNTLSTLFMLMLFNVAPFSLLAAMPIAYWAINISTAILQGVGMMPMLDAPYHIDKLMYSVGILFAAGSASAIILSMFVLTGPTAGFVLTTAIPTLIAAGVFLPSKVVRNQTSRAFTGVYEFFSPNKLINLEESSELVRTSTHVGSRVDSESGSFTTSISSSEESSSSESSSSSAEPSVSRRVRKGGRRLTRQFTQGSVRFAAASGRVLLTVAAAPLPVDDELNREFKHHHAKAS